MESQFILDECKFVTFSFVKLGLSNAFCFADFLQHHSTVKLTMHLFFALKQLECHSLLL